MTDILPLCLDQPGCGLARDLHPSTGRSAQSAPAHPTPPSARPIVVTDE
jgi:hypothetical protein